LIIALSRDRRALMASFQYLLLGTVGASFILLGIGLLYQSTGTLNMQDMAQRIPDSPFKRPIYVSFAFILVGISLKSAIFPLHNWLVSAYRYAPSAITVFLAGSATKVAIYVLLRFIYSVYGEQLAFDELKLQAMLLPVAILSMLVPALIATQQNNIKRLLAFSSLSQLGYMLLGIAMNNLNGLTATVLHLFNHALMKTALFMSIGVVFLHVGSHRIDKIAGLGRLMPLTFFAFVMAALSLIGVPLTAGFISKWYLVVGALDNQWWSVAVIILVSSLVAVVYLWKVVEAAYFIKPKFGNAQEEICDAPLSMLVPLYILIAANFWFGLDTSWSIGSAREAAEVLLSAGGRP